MTHRKKLTILRDDDLGDCQRCHLSETRKNIVFGRGNPDASLMFIGEGPGADEDAQGEPFVGKAGQLLDRIVAAMGMDREAVYIANIVKCRCLNDQGGNRPPAKEEVEKCIPFLKKQIAIINPAVIVTMGNPATRSLLNTEASISSLRGKWTSYDGIPVMPTFHPAFLLRTPAGKPYLWRDMQKVLKRLGA